MIVGELVGGVVVEVEPKVLLREAVLTMKSNEVGALAVCEQGRLVGIFTERDLVMACSEAADLDKATVSDWMTSDPDSLDPDMRVSDAGEWMLAAGYRHLPVVYGDELVGMVSIKDILWALTDSASV